MNFKELATARFSVRKFTDEAVSQADLDAIMTCVQLAPSACNRQPWKFLLLASDIYSSCQISSSPFLFFPGFGQSSAMCPSGMIATASNPSTGNRRFTASTS